MIPLFFRVVYTYRYVQIESVCLGALYFGGMALIVVWSVVQCFLQHQYVARPQTYLETTFWRYSAVDGNWWYKGDPSAEDPHYCGRTHWWANDSYWGYWGSDAVPCRDPERQSTTFFHFDHNLLKAATSIAYGTEVNATEIYLFKHIEKTGIVFQVNYFNEVETREVEDCRAVDVHGHEIPSRWQEVTKLSEDPSEITRRRYLLLSVEDILKAAGRSWDEPGQEQGYGMDTALPYRLQGVEIIAEVTLKNFHRPFVFSNRTECQVHFRIFRDQFTEVNRFYRGEELLAIQHGLRMRVVGSASLGYPSLTTGLQTLAVGICMVTCVGTLVENVAAFLHPARSEVNKAMCQPLVLGNTARTKDD